MYPVNGTTIEGIGEVAGMALAASARAMAALNPTTNGMHSMGGSSGSSVIPPYLTNLQSFRICSCWKRREKNVWGGNVKGCYWVCEAIPVGYWREWKGLIGGKVVQPDSFWSIPKTNSHDLTTKIWFAVENSPCCCSSTSGEDTDVCGGTDPECEQTDWQSQVYPRFGIGQIVWCVYEYGAGVWRVIEAYDNIVEFQLQEPMIGCHKSAAAWLLETPCTEKSQCTCASSGSADSPCDTPCEHSPSVSPERCDENPPLRKVANIRVYDPKGIVNTQFTTHNIEHKMKCQMSCIINEAVKLTAAQGGGGKGGCGCITDGHGLNSAPPAALGTYTACSPSSGNGYSNCCSNGTWYYYVQTNSGNRIVSITNPASGLSLTNYFFNDGSGWEGVGTCTNILIHWGPCSENQGSSGSCGSGEGGYTNLCVFISTLLKNTLIIHDRELEKALKSYTSCNGEAPALTRGWAKYNTATRQFEVISYGYCSCNECNCHPLAPGSGSGSSSECQETCSGSADACIHLPNIGGTNVKNTCVSVPRRITFDCTSKKLKVEYCDLCMKCGKLEWSGTCPSSGSMDADLDATIKEVMRPLESNEIELLNFDIQGIEHLGHGSDGPPS